VAEAIGNKELKNIGSKFIAGPFMGRMNKGTSGFSQI
jgi:hypothetical protein